MGKQSNKSKRENEDLDLILERLMQSFSQEDNDEDTDEEESSDPDDNAEFNQLLQQIMAGSNSASIETKSNEESSDEIDESEFIRDEATEEAAVIADKEIVDNEPVITNDEVITENEATCEEVSPSLYEKSTDENQSESDVDNVLQLMFSGSSTHAPEPEPEPVEAVVIEDEVIEDEVVEDEVIEDEIIEDEVIENEVVKDESIEATVAEDEITESEETEAQIVEDEYLEDEEDECDITEDEPGDYAPVVEDEEYFNEPDPIDEDDSCDIRARLITDPEEYTYDPLQSVLPDFTPAPVSADKKDSVVGNPAKIVNNIGASDSKNEEISLDSNDISLLLKFGYGEEVKSRIGEVETQKAIAAKDNEFSPESHKTPHGFCGKELTDKRDTKRIREKFKSDKTIIIIQIILIFILTLVTLVLEGFFEFISDRSSYLAVCAVEMVIIAIAFGVLSKKLISGILGIIRFEANIYSILAYLIFSYTICNIITSLVYIIKATTIDTSGLMIFGLCILFYMLITLAAELLNCLRESSNFDMMRRTERFYTAEKREKSSGEKSSKIGAFNDENAYRLIRTSLLGGYFRKSSNSISCNINLIYVIGVVPIISLIIGCASALIGEDVMCGVYSMMITTLLCIPFSYILIPSATEYVTSIYFRTKKIAFIGKDAAEDLAKANALYFDDTDAVEIISYTEIHPSKSADGQKDLEIAQRVFASLDGPLAEFAYKINDSESEDPITKGEVVINSISENGIEIYFDSSTNILIGDKSYMNAHSIRVKTDSNLNSTIKGFDRSVIYMAFDGIPKLGFIVTSKIKSEFSAMISKLDESGIKVFVDSYEPQINDLYFEQNKQEGTPSVSVCKSEEYESTDYKPICDGSVICSSDCYALADAIVECRNIVRRRKKNQRTHFALVATGIFFACLLTALLNVDRAIFIISGLKSHISLVFNFIMLISLTPGIIGIVNTVKSLRRDKEKPKETK